MSSDKNPTRVAAGLKATIARDDVSDAAKLSAQERLDHMGATTHDDQPAGLNSHAIGGYKATLSNEATSDKAKAHAREILEAAGYTVSEEHANTDEHQVRVLAGYKAALHNPRVSEAAKEHAREYLKEHNAL
ncbi:Conidiation protein 6-domain-containing protein [Mycena alexandri]|uniref:Conidiation protein 6-domain-containing protein n=1 Tax=Mycena alexandri TaxID=1745969 RepID=A0AAD6XCY0_9AGAR|nr:Conidiation protein 6-domain-containing protein [Mycena alexandri]